MNFQTSTIGLGLSDLYLKKAAAGKEIEAKFYSLLDSKINIPMSVRSQASTSHNFVRDNLSSEHDRDPTFPRIMSIMDRDFLGGSFARHTKIKPLDDIDIFFPIDGHGLTFTHDHIKYGVYSDGILSSNPILLNRWAVNGNISSSKVIEEFCRTLNKWYPNSTVKQNGQAVTIRLTSVAVQKESDPGLGFDIVPCFFIKENDPNKHNFYVIPDGNNGWIRTNPRVDTNINETLHEYHNEYFRPIIKLLKYWNASSMSGKINSYFIELIVSRAFCNRGSKITSLQQGLSEAFQILGNAVWSQEIAYTWIERAPEVTAGDLSITNRALANHAAQTAKEANELFNSFQFTASSLKWKTLFRDLE